MHVLSKKTYNFPFSSATSFLWRQNINIAVPLFIQLEHSTKVFITQNETVDR